MFKYKPDSEVALQKRPYTLNQDPVVYEEGTQWQMPGWRGELATDAPTGEELGEQHPRLYAQMQRHNEIGERAWRYYNLDAVDAQEFGEKKRTQEAMEEEARALAASMAPENQDDYDEYGDYDVEEKPKKKKGKSKKGRRGASRPSPLRAETRAQSSRRRSSAREVGDASADHRRVRGEAGDGAGATGG